MFRNVLSRTLSGVSHGDVIAGSMGQADDPEWAPLVALIGTDLAGWFMWMFAVELDDGSRVHAYKHTATRRYFHIADDGRVFIYIGDDGYREIDRQDAIAEAFAGWTSLR